MNSRISAIVWIGVTAIACLAGGYQLAKWRDDGKLVVNTPPVAAKKLPVAEQEIEIPQPFIESSSIKVEQVNTGNVSGEILAAAVVAAVPGAEATVIARAAGTITRINKRLGDSVKVGETIALVDSLDATRMTAERNAAVAKLQLARKVFARESDLYGKGVTPRQDMETAQSTLAVAEAEALRASMIIKAANVAADGRSVHVISPVNGRVVTESAVVGAFVQPDAELFRIANDKLIQIEAYVTATDVAEVRPGDSATILGRNGSELAAKVRSITPSVSGSNQTATAILVPDVDATALVLGEGVQVRLHTTASSQNNVIVPEDAIQNIEGQDTVFFRTKSGFTPHPVVVGQRANGYAQILSGVDPGVSIATQNAFLIKAEMIKNAPEED